MKLKIFPVLTAVLIFASCNSRVQDISNEYAQMLIFSRIGESFSLSEQIPLSLSWDSSFDKYFNQEFNTDTSSVTVSSNNEFNAFLNKLNKSFGVPKDVSLLNMSYTGYEKTFGPDYELFTNIIKMHYENDITIVHEVMFFKQNKKYNLVRIKLGTGK